QLVELGLLLLAFLPRHDTRQYRRARPLRQLDQLRRAAILRGEEGAVVSVRRKKNARQSVVVLLRDRIELVVVAAGARGGDAEQTLRNRVNLFVGQVQRKLPRVRLVDALGPERQKPGGDDLLGALLVVLRRQQIA